MVMSRSRSTRFIAKFTSLLFAFGFQSCIGNPIGLTKKSKYGLVILQTYDDDTFLIERDDIVILITCTYNLNSYHI